MDRTYRVDIIRDETKDPLNSFYVTKENIVDAAIEATQKFNSRKWSDEDLKKKVRVGKIEEIKGEII